MPETQNRPIRAVLFDAVGTLLLPREPVAETYCRLARPLGSRLGAADVARNFAAALAADGRRLETSEELERLRWRQIVAQSLTDLGIEHIDPLFELLWDHFARPDSWRLAPEVPGLWRRLTAAGFVLGIASNFDGRLEAVRQSHPPLDEARWCFVSSQIGYRKPAPQFFAAIEQRLDMRPDEILLVGDDHDHDFAAARLAGWSAVLVEPDGLSQPGQVASLMELVV
jgi:putative hydrolase of the HAD superfamily